MHSFEKIKQVWNPHFIHTSPLFSSIEAAYSALIENSSPDANKHWASLSDYNQCLKNLPTPAQNANDKKIQFVEQCYDAQLAFESQYEPRIYLHGEVQTRLENWHDFFQVLVWKTWPNTKTLLNKLHYQSSIKRSDKQRSPTENFLTLFDECGIVILSHRPELLAMIRDFQWKKLFVDNADKFGRDIFCINFGHAMYEKALAPYIGMTAHALLIETTQAEDFTKNSAVLDDLICRSIENKSTLTPKVLTPFPLLGVPGWHDNQDNNFYSNQSYFRSGRREKRGAEIKNSS